MRSGILSCLLAFTASAGPLIVVDPGHGGTQDGAYSPTNGKEKDVSLQVAKRLKKALEDGVGATVTMTREKDQTLALEERVRIANEQKPALFISIHANSMPMRWQRLKTEGIETYFLSAAASGEDARKVAARENAESKQLKAGQGDTLAYILADLQRSENHAQSSRLAYAVQEKVIAATQAIDRGVQQAPFYVLMGLEAPAVLVEIGFISHPEESKKLADADYQDKLAGAIAEAVKGYLAGTAAARDGEAP
ncbi:MAG: N-acetylmuramoyl-L-alanine amidase [Myxococcaceae bacterium]